MKRFCEICGGHALVFRRVRKRGKFFGKLIVTQDKRHSLCSRHHDSMRESEMQNRRFADNQRTVQAA